MATKRMFDKAIIDTDKFMDLPMPSKALYFLLGMESDDEGFVSYKKVMRIHGGNEDDIKILAAKNFVIPFPSGVVVITDWNKNNWLDSRRIKPTEYQNEKKLLKVDKNNKYVLSNGLASIEENSIEEISEANASEKKNMRIHDTRKFDSDYEPRVDIDGNKIETKFDKEKKEKDALVASVSKIIAEFDTQHKKRVGGEKPRGDVRFIRKVVKEALRLYTEKELISFIPGFFDNDYYENTNWAIWTMMSTKVLNQLKNGE